MSRTQRADDAGLRNGGRLPVATKWYYRVSAGTGAGDVPAGDPPWYQDAGSGTNLVDGGANGPVGVQSCTVVHGAITGPIGNAAYTRNLPHAAPKVVYQTERWADPNPPSSAGGVITYPLNGLVPGRRYGLRSHHVESNFTAAAQRRFHIDVNGKRVRSNMDVWDMVGANTPVIVEAVATADASGIITVVYTDGLSDHGELEGIEVFELPRQSWPNRPSGPSLGVLLTAILATTTGDTGTLAASTAGGAAALSGTSTVTGDLAPSGTGTAALAGTSTVTGTLAASTAGGAAALAGTSTNPGTLAAASGGGQAAMSGSPVVTGDLGASSSGGQASIVGAETVTGTLGASTTGGQASLVGVPLTGDLIVSTTGGRASIVQTGGTPVEDEWHPDGNLGALVWRPDFYAEPPLS